MYNDITLRKAPHSIFIYKIKYNMRIRKSVRPRNKLSKTSNWRDARKIREIALCNVAIGVCFMHSVPDPAEVSRVDQC